MNWFAIETGSGEKTCGKLQLAARLLECWFFI
jgi:hypothetical protein